MFREPDDGGGAFLVDEIVAERVLKSHKSDRSLLGLAGLVPDTVHEEPDPGQQIAVLAGTEKEVVVLVPVLLEEGGQVEERLGEGAPQHEHQGDHQPADPAVAVEEGVDHFELVMSQGELHQERHVLFVQEVLPVG